MKNRILGGVLIILSGALVALGPQFLFTICDQTHHHDDVHSICYWTAQAAIGIGIVLGLLGIAYLIFADQKVRSGLSIGIAGSFVLLLLIANVLIGVDAMPDMPCQLATLPALNIISIFGLLGSAANTVYLLRGPAVSLASALDTPGHAANTI
jgi:hypothetical protein